MRTAIVHYVPVSMRGCVECGTEQFSADRNPAHMHTYDLDGFKNPAKEYGHLLKEYDTVINCLQAREKQAQEEQGGGMQNIFEMDW